MIEMSVDKKTALSSDESGDPSLPPPSQQHRELSGHCPRNSQQPTETVAKLAREDVEHQHKMANVACRPVSDGIVAATDSSMQSQNGMQQPRPHQQQRLNKRRSTMSSSFKHPVFGKRRRRANSESESVLPTNFLLGGNIFDPLNLNSLLDEEVNRALNAETPKSSPLPAKSRDPVEILIPRDITDPLNLNGCTAGDGGLLLTPLKSSGGRRRHRNRHHGGAGGGAGGTGGGAGKGGDGGLTQLDPSESERGKTSSALQTERTVESSALHLKSGGVADGPDPKVPEEEAVESSSVPTREAQCYSGPTSANILEEREDGATAAPVSESATPIVPTLHASTTPSHRQRKRKRTTSRSESSGTACWDKSRPPHSAPGSVQPTQPVRTPATGAQAGPADRPHQPPNHRRQQRTPSRQKPKQPQQQQKFQYGNYNKYYGYRNPGSSEDPRVHVLQPEWFQGKAVLDLGCNTGHLTLSIAKSWRPARIVGLDIDGALIHAARQNIRHYLSEVHTLQARSAGRGDESTTKGTKRMQGGGVELEGGGAREKMEEDSMEMEEQRAKAEKGGRESDGMVPRVQEMDISEEGDCVLETGRVEGESTAMEMVNQGLTETGKRVDTASSNGNHLFPVSLRMSRGPIAAPPLPDTNILPPGDFPANVTFVTGNYVLESDLLLQTQREEFDVVLCLSVTKWVHLNWGDGGLKRLFHRVYRHLRPGGLFILEPQPWSSYSKRKKLTEAIYKNYYSIRFRPEQFSAYLTSEVGFSSYELIGTPKSSSRGFQRPIYLFHKGPAPRK